MYRMQRQEWLDHQKRVQQNNKTRKQPKPRSGLRPFRKNVQAYADWVKDMLGIAEGNK